MLRARRRPAPPGLFLSQDKLSPPLPSQPLAASILPSVSVIFEFLSISYNRRGQNLSFCDWLVSGAWFQRPPRRSGRGVLPLQAEQQSAVRAASLLSAVRGAGPPCYPRCAGGASLLSARLSIKGLLCRFHGLAVANTGVQISLRNPVFSSFRYAPRSGNAGSHGTSVCLFFGDRHTGSHSRSSTLASYQRFQSLRTPYFPLFSGSHLSNG